MAEIESTKISCGVFTLSHIWHLKEGPFSNWSAKVLIDKLIKENWKNHTTLVFSDADSYGHGRNLADYITTNNLGPITEHGPIRNPNSGNMIRVWCWSLDMKELETVEEDD